MATGFGMIVGAVAALWVMKNLAEYVCRLWVEDSEKRYGKNYGNTGSKQ